MVNLAEKIDDADSLQLAEAEISRILSALNHAEFKKSDFDLNKIIFNSMGKSE